MVQISDKKLKPFWNMLLEGVKKIPPPSTPLFRDDESRDTGRVMNIANLILDLNSVTVSYLLHCDGLLQNTTAILSQNLREVCYKMCHNFCYKMQQLLQNATSITNCDSTVGTSVKYLSSLLSSMYLFISLIKKVQSPNCSSLY